MHLPKTFQSSQWKATLRKYLKPAKSETLVNTLHPQKLHVSQKKNMTTLRTIDAEANARSRNDGHELTLKDLGSSLLSELSNKGYFVELFLDKPGESTISTDSPKIQTSSEDQSPANRDDTHQHPFRPVSIDTPEYDATRVRSAQYFAWKGVALERERRALSEIGTASTDGTDAEAELQPLPDVDIISAWYDRVEASSRTISTAASLVPSNDDLFTELHGDNQGDHACQIQVPIETSTIVLPPTKVALPPARVAMPPPWINLPPARVAMPPTRLNLTSERVAPTTKPCILPLSKYALLPAKTAMPPPWINLPPAKIALPPKRAEILYGHDESCILNWPIDANEIRYGLGIYNIPEAHKVWHNSPQVTTSTSLRENTALDTDGFAAVGTGERKRKFDEISGSEGEFELPQVQQEYPRLHCENFPFPFVYQSYPAPVQETVMLCNCQNETSWASSPRKAPGSNVERAKQQNGKTNGRGPWSQQARMKSRAARSVPQIAGQKRKFHLIDEDTQPEWCALENLSWHGPIYTKVAIQRGAPEILVERYDWVDRALEANYYLPTNPSPFLAGRPGDAEEGELCPSVIQDPFFTDHVAGLWSRHQRLWQNKTPQSASVLPKEPYAVAVKDRCAAKVELWLDKIVEM